MIKKQSLYNVYDTSILNKENTSKEKRAQFASKLYKTYSENMDMNNRKPILSRSPSNISIVSSK
jgi:hypothetical protein